MKILSEKNIKTLRTDQDGEAEVVSDGKNFQIQSKNRSKKLQINKF